MSRSTLWGLADLATRALSALLIGTCALLLLRGADLYGRHRDALRESRDLATAYGYVSTKISQSDADGGVAVSEFGGTPCLLTGHGDYLSVLYWHDGSLMELFAYGEDLPSFAPGDGNPVARLDAFEPSMDGGLLLARLSVGGTEQTLRMRIRTWKE